MKWMLCLCLLVLPIGSMYGQVLLVHDGDDKASRAIGHRLTNYVEDVSLRSQKLDDFLQDSASNDPLSTIITLGANAFQQVCQQRDQPVVIAMLLGMEEYDAIKDSCQSHSTAVFAGAKLALRLSLLKQILPNTQRIGLLYSDALLLNEASYQQQAGEQGMRFVFRKTANDRRSVMRAVNGLLVETDVIFSVVDTGLYQPQVAQEVLRLMFHQKRIMLGTSDNFVKAGALYAIYSDIDSQIQGVAEILKSLAVPAETVMQPFYPKQMKVAFNPYLVRTFGIVLPSSGYLESVFGLCPESGCAKAPH